VSVLFNPDAIFSEEELDELAASIRAVGLIHPPVVRIIGNGGKILYYELIAGERRWRAAKRAGFDTIKVIVRDSDDEHAAKSTLIENVQRVNLNPIEMAEAFKKLLDVFRMTQEEVAEKVGKKRSTVANYLRLLSLPKSIQKELLSGSITMGHAKALLSLDSTEMQQRVTELIVKEQLTVREAEKKSQKLSKKTKKTKTRDQHIEELEEKLTHHFGTKVHVENSRRGGKITIHYYSLDDLERLLKAII